MASLDKILPDIYDIIKFIVPPITTLLAGYFGVKYGLKQIKIQKELDFTEKQLERFYSPLLGMHKYIRAKSELRLKVEQMSGEDWKEKCQAGLQPDIKPHEKEIAYNNKQLREEFIPLYRKMLDIFRENYYLSEQETRKFYPDIVEYVEIWNRYFDEGLPGDVGLKIGHTEEKLKPFYEELEKRTNILTGKISKK